MTDRAVALLAASWEAHLEQGVTIWAKGYAAGLEAPRQHPVCDFCDKPVIVRCDTSVNAGRPAWAHKETGFYTCGDGLTYHNIATVNGHPDPPAISKDWETAAADLIEILGDDHDEECSNLADLIEEVRQVIKHLRTKVADAATILNG